MRTDHAPDYLPNAMRYRLYLRPGWAYAQARGDGRRGFTTTVDRQAATAWPEAEALRLGRRLARRGLTVDLQPVDTAELAPTAGQA